MTLWEYMNKEYGLTLLDSEIQEILSLARQEIELPDEDEVNDIAEDYCMFQGGEDGEPEADPYTHQCFKDGFISALRKVRNPYPQTIRFKDTKDKGEAEE